MVAVRGRVLCERECRFAERFFASPPHIFTHISRSLSGHARAPPPPAAAMSHGPIFKALRAYGLRGTFDKLYKMRTFKFGKLVGTDSLGNKYFENYVDYPHPHNRWVEYSGDKNFYEVDASNVPAEWHGWLHNSTADPPTEVSNKREKHPSPPAFCCGCAPLSRAPRAHHSHGGPLTFFFFFPPVPLPSRARAQTTVGSTHRVEPLQNSQGSSAPYARNLGGVIAPPSPNHTQSRPRGYGLGNGIWSAPFEESYWTQPGYPTDKRNRATHVSARRGRLGFSLRDTPLTIQAKAAARAGLSLEEYQAVADESHPTRALLLLTGGQVSREDAADLVAAARQGGGGGDGALIEEALAGIPEDMTKRDQALRLAVNVPLSKEDVGSLASAIASVLTAEEQTLLDEGLDIEGLRDRAGVHQAIIDEYKLIDTKEARRGVEEAVAIRDKCLEKVRRRGGGERGRGGGNSISPRSLTTYARPHTLPNTERRLPSSTSSRPSSSRWRPPLTRRRTRWPRRRWRWSFSERGSGGRRDDASFKTHKHTLWPPASMSPPPC
jgi:NADH:ubiquinone oxidoreductase subunit